MDLKKRATIVLAAALAGGLVACGGDSSGGSGEGLDLVAYSTPQAVYEDVLIPAFQKTPEGEGVEFSSSFAASGDQSRAVEGGQPADFVHLPVEADITRLVDAGLVAEDWSKERYDGQIQQSVVVFVTRPGNPKDVQDWPDLLRYDVDVLTPNPFTSGEGRWNMLAIYGATRTAGFSEQRALEFIYQMLQNTVVQDDSAQAALDTFLGGQGDVLLTSESVAIAAMDAGEEVDYVVPDETILIETLGVVPDDAPNARTAAAFRDFLLSDQGQTLFGENGYRPVDPKVLSRFEDEYPTPPGLFEIDDLGGWKTLEPELFDPDTGEIAKIEREFGEPVQ